MRLFTFPNIHEISLRPYNGKLFYAKTKRAYKRAHCEIFRTPDVIQCSVEGRFYGGDGKDGMWTYLVWADNPHSLAHEMAHVVLHVFQRCGIDPRDAGGEPFCYMLSQLILDASGQ